jgi:hypothetical protein
MDKVQESFWEYHKLNPHIYRLFKAYAEEVKKTGKKKYSIWAVANRIRWHFDVEVVDPNSNFKISNDYLAFYSRLLMKENPELQGFFSTKRMRRGALQN